MYSDTFVCISCVTYHPLTIIKKNNHVAAPVISCSGKQYCRAAMCNYSLMVLGRCTSGWKRVIPILGIYSLWTKYTISACRTIVFWENVEPLTFIRQFLSTTFSIHFKGGCSCMQLCLHWYIWRIWWPGTGGGIIGPLFSLWRSQMLPIFYMEILLFLNTLYNIICGSQTVGKNTPSRSWRSAAVRAWWDS